MIILGLLAAGSMVSLAINGLVPGSVIGMMLMFAGLQLKLIKPEWVSAAANGLTRNMALFFVPAGVGVMVAFEVIATTWIHILVITIVSTIAVIAAVGLTQQWMERHRW